MMDLKYYVHTPLDAHVELANNTSAIIAEP